ncbi:MAG: hypothetical protein JO045_22145 [Mycobacterium sp.]|nr:hypothetical protein [Mycobacterium sp.]
MTELDKYRPPDYDNPTGPYSRWAFHTEPQFEQRGRSWTAWYPGADWTVSAPSKQEAITKLRAESIRREDRYASDEAVAARHLQEPIPGIYAMDIGLYNELRETETDADLNRAFKEAERARVAGQTYTKDDYFRNGGGH